MKITKHYPGYVDTVNSNNPESGEFKTKKELLNIPFVKEWMEDWDDEFHWEIDINKGVDGNNYAYLMEVANDFQSYWVAGIVTQSSDDEEVKVMKNWFPKWDVNDIKPPRPEFKEVDFEF